MPCFACESANDVPMSKKVHRVRKRASAEHLEAFDQSLTTLEHLARTYDTGYPPIIFSMATEIHKILAGNSDAMRLRGQLKFTSPDHGDESRMLNALHKLVGAEIQGKPPTLKFLPAFRLEGGTP